MASYTCLNCLKEIPPTMMGKRIRCPYCSYKVLFKSRTTITRVKAV